MLADLRMRVQGSNESLRSFLTEAGAKLKAMGYPREIWLDLIYPALHGSVQLLLTGFAAENGTYDSVLNDCDRIERMSKSVCPTQQTFTVNAMYVDQNRTKPDILLQNSIVDEKLQNRKDFGTNLFEHDLEQRTKVNFTKYSNSSQNTRKPPIRCFFCDKVDHIKRHCFRFLATLNNGTQQHGNRNSRSMSANCNDNRDRSRFRVTFTDKITTRNNRNDCNYFKQK
jgi:hypothetical protein